MAVKFEKKDDRVTVAFMDCARETWDGKRFMSTTAARAIKEREGWRVDRADAIHGAWMPWEAITDTPHPTLQAAKATIRDFAKVCKLQPGSPERKRYGLSGASRRRPRGLQPHGRRRR